MPLLQPLLLTQSRAKRVQLRRRFCDYRAAFAFNRDGEIGQPAKRIADGRNRDRLRSHLASQLLQRIAQSADVGAERHRHAHALFHGARQLALGLRPKQAKRRVQGPRRASAKAREIVLSCSAAAIARS
ncbi:hypothetical protein [Xanthomonas phaseoli]|uniref:hypothetical protein n=1 Tax=Xanthomonas phaseoli TaxID=1985254 RepID=UPI0012FF553D|nr:hypothetical protein [Xanthomonas phaseoli]